MKYLTVQTIKTALAALGLTARRTEHGEIRVAFRADAQHGEDSAYYAADWPDAYETGVAMAVARRANQTAWAAITYREGAK